MTATPRIESPHLLVKGQDTAISAALEEYGGDKLIALATAKVYDASGVLVATYTDTDTKAPTVTVLAAVTASADYSELWRVVWTLDDVTYPTAAYVVKYAWMPNVTDRDLYSRAPALDPSGPNPITDRETFEPERIEASRELRDALVQKGKRPWLVYEPHALRAPLMLLALSLVFEGFSHRDPAQKATSDDYRRKYEAALSRVTFLYDADQDGESDSTERESAQGSTWLCSV